MWSDKYTDCSERTTPEEEERLESLSVEELKEEFDKAREKFDELHDELDKSVGDDYLRILDDDLLPAMDRLILLHGKLRKKLKETR